MDMYLPKINTKLLSLMCFLILTFAGCSKDEPSPASKEDGSISACPSYDPNRQLFWGDLHVHTSMSFDSYSAGNTGNGPAEALLFASGEPLALPPFDETGMSMRGTVQLDAPLDFVALTDHAEFIGEITLCLDKSSPAYGHPQCVNFRDQSLIEDFIGADIALFGWGLQLGEKIEPPLCSVEGVDCDAARKEAWDKMQQVTNNAYQRCEFTTLHGYEWTAQDIKTMWHRNVIFGTDTVPSMPITYYDTENWQILHEKLKSACDSVTGCDVLVIPHNPNYSEGLLFEPVAGDLVTPLDAETSRLRAEMEPVVEIVQVKNESECRNGFSRYPMDTVDEFCDFEKKDFRLEICRPGDVPCDILGQPAGCVECLRECGEGEFHTGCTAAHDYVRNALKVGMEQYLLTGVNPYSLGFVGATDTHNGLAGYVREDAWVGHHGSKDDTLEEQLEEAPLNFAAIHPTSAGITAVWAEENTREAIFAALKRRETYATSGPRITVRFFGGWDYPSGMCDRATLEEEGYAGGVPMGGNLPRLSDKDAKPTFVLSAQREALPAGGAGVPLQRLQIIKVWIDETGAPREQVFDVTPGAVEGEPPDYSATVDLSTCKTSGPGRDSLCATWTDAAFLPDMPVAYYARVIENPTCRWNAWLCALNQVECPEPSVQTVQLSDAPEGCCDPDVPKTIQERAYTSPIFFEPGS